MIKQELSLHKGGLLADDMGLGKTLQALVLSRLNGQGTTLFVVPTSLLQQWITEAKEKLADNVRILKYHGASKSNVAFEDYDFVVTTYGTLSSEFVPEEDNNKQVRRPRAEKRICREKCGALLKFKWLRVVLDESQYIKSMSSLRNISVRALLSTYRWCLSGTPVQNNMNELFATTRFLRINISRSQLNCCRELMKTFALRRTKNDVLTLPAKSVTRLECNMTDAELKYYKALCEEDSEAIADMVANGTIWGNLHVLLVMLLRRRQCCDDLRMVGGKFEGPTGKQQAIVKKVGEIYAGTAETNDKILVFSFFRDMIGQVQQQLESQNIKSLTFTGDMTMVQRQQCIARFRSSTDIRVLILSTQCANVGLNLTCANHVILSEPWWNPFVHDQAIDRVHRMGQTKTVQAYECCVMDTIEDLIFSQYHSTKRHLVSSMWNDTTGAAQNISSGSGMTVSAALELLQNDPMARKFDF